MISTPKVADVLTDVPPKRLDDPSQSPEIGCGSIGRLIYIDIQDLVRKIVGG